MEKQSRWERILLYGIVPIVSALLGALATVWASNFMGHTAPSDAAIIILQDNSLSASDKAKLLSLLNNDTDKFYGFLSSILTIVSMVSVAIGFAVAQRIRESRRPTPSLPPSASLTPPAPKPYSLAAALTDSMESP